MMEDLTEEAHHSQVQELVLLPYILPSCQNITVPRVISVGPMVFFQITIRILSGVGSVLGKLLYRVYKIMTEQLRSRLSVCFCS
jgi:hypothetical protein